MNIPKMIRLTLLSVAIVALSVSQGFCQSAGNSRGIASADIKYSSLDRVIKAAKDVFTSSGFDVVSQKSDSIVFERPGSRGKDLAYGGFEGGVIEQVVITFQEKDPALIWLNCDVYMVKGRGSDYSMEDKTKVMRAFGGAYRKLVNKVKVMAEAQPGNEIKGKQ
jgi:hypothetical protein